jgi:MFS family permease
MSDAGIAFHCRILSDRIGRRPVLLFGLANNFACALCFGFSVNFRMAILTRFFNGLLTGVSGVGKT